MVIGITGSSGAGKSTVCEILSKRYGVKIISADKIAKELSKNGTKYYKEIVDNFGVGILLPNRELNRRKLADIIYSDIEKRELLNKCTFKYIRKEIIHEIESNLDDTVAIDASLLFEARLDEICNYMVAVVSDSKQIQIQRIIERDGIDEEHAKARLSAQPSNKFYISNCHYYILNNDNMDFLKKQVKEFMSIIC